MPLSTIIASKDAAPQLLGVPLVLAELTMIDGSVERFSTHPLNNTEGASSYTYNGNAYFARIVQEAFSSIQARSEQGIDRVDNITLTMGDSDRLLLGIEKALGMAGAIVTMRLVMWQADSANFTSDSFTPFVGIANGPSYDQNGRGDQMTITATSSHNDARKDDPPWQVQYTCGNDFPLNSSERLGGAGDMSHHCWSCGYDPDQAVTDPEGGGDARRGNTTTANLTNSYGRQITDSSGNYIWCGKTRPECEARGMFNKDSSNRPTRRFNGIEWAPINREVSSKSYLDGKTIRFTQIGRNDASFAERFPVLYTADTTDNGGQWVRPVVGNVVGDANETRFEFVTCQDYTGTDGSYLVQLVVNGVIVPFFANSPDQKLFFVSQVSNGSRTGGINPAALYDSLGDPYGSLTSGCASIYRQLADSGSAPNVMALSRGPYIKIPNSTDGTSSGQAGWGAMQRTSNPVWHLLDRMIWNNWKYTEIDLQSFIDAAPYCDVTISYVDYTGTSNTHKRFRSQFVIDKARKFSEVRTGILNNFGGQLTKDPVTGKAKLIVRKTLADQQGSPISGSNYSTAIASVRADGTSGSGYVAFLFNETTILKDHVDDPPKLPWSIVPFASGANEIRFSFQNEENSFSQDRITIKDADAVSRAGGYQSSQEIPLDYNIIGCPNFDQGFRRGNVILAELNRGNPRRDPAGTMSFGPFAVSGIRIVHLRAGDIVLCDWLSYGFQPVVQLQSPPSTPITGFLARVQKIDWATNFQRAMVTVVWHEDVWYTDKYGQQGPPPYSNPRKGTPAGPPYPWQAFYAQPVINDSVFGTPPGGYMPTSWWSYSVAQLYPEDASATPIAQVAVTGVSPVNSFSPDVQPPLIGGIQCSTTSSGGTIPGGVTLYFAVTAIDSNGKQSTLSTVFSVTVPSGTNTNTITTPTIYWQAGSVGYCLYGGTDSNNLAEQAADTLHTPGTVQITGLLYETIGPPDIRANALRFEAKRVYHSGVWADEVAAVDTNTLTFAPHDETGAPSTFTAGQWVGYDIMQLANVEGSTGNIPIANYRVSANDGTNLTVSPDPKVLGVLPGMLFTVLCKPDPSSTATTIVEPNFVNAYGSKGLNLEGTQELRVFAGTGMLQTATIISNTATSFTLSEALFTPLDSTSRFVTCELPWTEAVETEKIVNGTLANNQTWKFDISNYKDQVVLTRMSVLDAQGVSSLDAFAPFRLLYISGAGMNQTVIADDYQMTSNDVFVLCDCRVNSKNIVVTLPPIADTKTWPRYVIKIEEDTTAFTVTVQSFLGDPNFTDVLTNPGDTCPIAPVRLS